MSKEGAWTPAPQEPSKGFFQNPERKILLVRWAIIIVDIALSVIIAATAITEFMDVSGISQTEDVFVSVYALLFTLILFAHEISQIVTLEWLDNIFRKNFGFINGVKGKGIFLVFIAFLLFGLSDSQNLGIYSGVLLCSHGLILILADLKWPEVMEHVLKKNYSLPTRLSN